MAQAGQPKPGVSLAVFQVGRLMGYSVLGALVASAMQGLGWLTLYSAALRPVWSFFHAFAVVLGLWLVWRAQMPFWAQALGRATWQRLLAWANRCAAPQWGAPLIAGMLWALLPCGLLYSALIVAALAGEPWQGAGVMATFAMASGVVLLLGPWALLRWGAQIRAPGWGMRLAGLALALSSGAALYLGLVHNQAPWCV
jgi:sulfite exporter TauE/SafE